MNNKRVIAIILFLVLLGFMAWFFSNVLIYMFIALVLTVLGTPLMKLLTKIKIGKWKFPTTLAAVITLLVIVASAFVIVFFAFPLLINEFQTLLAFDPEMVAINFDDWFAHTELWLKDHGILQRSDNLSVILMTYANSVLQDFSITNLFSSAISMMSALFIGTFAVLFMLFFSLKDNQIFFKMIRKVIPTSYRENYDHILEETKSQVTRYFTGVFCEMIIIGCLEGVICHFLGVPHAALIGFFGGLLNIIPYVGPLIAIILGIIISVTSIITSVISSSAIIWVIVKVIGTFICCKLIDDTVLQPIIYGKSVQAHPLEIFIVILMAAHVGGVLGLILAVPAYSFLRIIVKELFGAYYTENNPEAIEEPITTEKEQL